MPPNTLSLKQRLAALSLAPSSPAVYDGESPASPRSPFNAKRKGFNFNAPWKKQQDSPTNGTRGDSAVVQEVLSKMIFQAGVDYETRPMVVLNASALPDPQFVSYDLLLSRILSYLNLYVEADYTVVFFAAGGRHTPGWNWVWKAYRSLSRKYRKNLKQLYIVHSSFFSKMLFSLAGAIISPKFFRKLVYLSTLSELAHYVPLTQIDIPPAVYQENLKYERKISLPIPTRSSIFGVPLEDIMGYDGEKGGIPRVVKDSIQFIRESGLLEEGLFRRSPSSVLLRAAQDAYDRGNVVSLDTFGDPHLAAVLLKKYLRDLPEPIFPESLYPTIRRCPHPTNDPLDMSSVTYVREILLPSLPPCAYILLSHVLHLMHDVSLRSASNRMDEYNLAIVLCPNLVKGTSPARDVMMCAVAGAPALTSPMSPAALPTSYESKTTLGSIVVLCIRRYYEIFDDIRDRSEAMYGPPSWQDHSLAPSRSASASPLPQASNYVIHDEDDDDLDDEDVVMPHGPTHRSHNSGQQAHLVTGSPPSAWGAAGGNGVPPTSSKRHRSNPSGGSSSGIRSVHTAFGENQSTNGFGYQPLTYGKTKSLVNIEKGAGLSGHRKGSISIGRGTTRKSSGAGVEALSVTAEGFFSAPKDAPPLPSRNRRPVDESP